MKEKLSILLSRTSFMVILLSLLFFALNIQNILFYYNLPVIGGWDGQAHASVGQYYTENIFPKTWGWIPNWSGGIPFPQFYPPMFFFVTALLSKIFFFVKYEIVFKIFVIILQVILPGTLAWVTKSITKNNYASWLSGVFCIVLASLHFSEIANFGLAITATFNSGFVAQLLGFIFLLCWIRYFLFVEVTKKARFLSIFFLSCVLLSNAHIVPIATLYFLTTFIVKSKHTLFPFQAKKIFEYISLYFFQGITPLALAAFWYAPLIKEYTYLLTMPLIVDTAYVLKSYWYIVSFVVIALLVSLRTRQTNILIVSIVNVLIAIISLSRFDEYFPYLPLHSARWLAEFFFLSIILVSYVLSIFLSHIPKGYKLYGTVLIIFISLTSFFWTHSYRLNTQGMYMGSKEDHLDEIISYLHNKKGRVLVESFFPNEPISGVFDSKIGPQTDGALTFTLRESSISTQFMVPTRNTLSQNKESWGFKSFKSFDKTFLNRSFDESIDRAAYLGITSFLIRTPFMNNKFEKSDKVQLEKDFGNWKLFTIKNTSPFAEILKYKPVLLFSPLNFKDRHINDYDYSRFQEELFLNKKSDIILVNPHTLFIDEDTDLDKFDIAVLSEYKYKNIEVAFNKLELFSRTHSLVLVFSQDPIFNRLAFLGNSHHIYVAPRSVTPQNENSLVSSADLGKLLDRLEEIKILVPYDKNVSITSSDVNASSIHVSISNPTDKELPVLIKESYFPTWVRKDDTDVYLATPTFMLTFAKSSFEIDFKKDSATTIGEIISLLTLCALIFAFLRKNKTRG